MKLLVREKHCINRKLMAGLVHAAVNLPAVNLAAVILAAAILAACAARPAATRTAGETAARIRAAVPAGDMAQALRSAAETYAGTSGGEPVEVEVMDGSLYESRVSAALLAGLDRYDLVLLNADALPRWNEMHALRPVEPAPGEEDALIWLGELPAAGLAALPAQADPLVLWYRTDRVKAEALASWATLNQLGQGGGGAALAGGDMDIGTDFAAALFAGDRQAYDALLLRGEASPEAARALEDFLRLLRGSDSSTAGWVNFTRQDVISALLDGRAAVGLAPLSAGERLLDCTKGGSACADGAPLLAAANLPGSECAGLGDVWVWAVPAHAAQPQAAGRFAAWLASEEGARSWAAAGGLAVNRKAVQAPLQGGAVPGGPAYTAAAARYLAGVKCYWKPFSGLTTADAAWRGLNGGLHRAAVGEISASGAIQAAADEIRTALKQGGVYP